MNDSQEPATGTGAASASALWMVVVTRLREFIRQPEAIFWVYGFPILMIVVLGIAFRNQGAKDVTIDIVAGPGADQVAQWLKGDGHLTTEVLPEDECRKRLRSGKSPLFVRAGDATAKTLEYFYDPTQPEAAQLRSDIDRRLQVAAGRADVLVTTDQHVSEPGGRYIDFLVPGLIGMGLMGGGLWGVGFAIVDLRIRKLLKRFVATPMRRSDFLWGLIISRMIFMIPEIVLMVACAWLFFGVQVYGSWLALIVVIVVGAVQFSGIGLLVAARCKTIESASGLMNLVMLPMWTLCGIFFSWERFPEQVHPLIKLLPLTPLNDALRAVMNEGATLLSLWPELLNMSLWGAGTFVLALAIFRWRD